MCYYRLDYAGPEILRGERYYGREQDVWAFGVVAYVLLVGECPFTTAEDAQESLGSPFANATIALDERCGEEKEKDGEEPDGGGALGDAAALVRACLRVEASARPTYSKKSCNPGFFVEPGAGHEFFKISYLDRLSSFLPHAYRSVCIPLTTMQRGWGLIYSVPLSRYVISLHSTHNLRLCMFRSLFLCA